MDTWDLMNDWYLVLPPSRPSAAQLARIDSQILGVDRQVPVAILGSTPEFRDFFYEAGFQQIYVFDRNASFYAAMNKARVHDNVEHFVHGNWIQTLPSFKNEFAVILSDLTSGNVPYENRVQFYEGITDALSEGGMFLDKVLTHHGDLYLVEELIQKYSHLPLNLLHINNFSSEALFCSELIDLNKTVDSTLFYNILSQRIQNERAKAFVENAKRITPPGCIWWYGRKWAQLSGQYCPLLTLTSAYDDEPSSPYYGNLKFFQLTKEK
jgi:hypothetical protein